MFLDVTVSRHRVAVRDRDHKLTIVDIALDDAAAPPAEEIAALVAKIVGTAVARAIAAERGEG